jgi:hypothetical protein
MSKTSQIIRHIFSDQYLHVNCWGRYTFANICFLTDYKVIKITKIYDVRYFHKFQNNKMSCEFGLVFESNIQIK